MTRSPQQWTRRHEWFDDHRELHALLEWLADRGEIRSLEDAISVLEKPWHYTNEHRQMTAEQRALGEVA